MRKHITRSPEICIFSSDHHLPPPLHPCPRSQMVRSTSEMVIHSYDTIGDVPPGLIGAATTISGSKLYLFGGSLPSASEPKPLAHLYELDLELWKWKELISAAADDPVSRARCFHTLDIWKDNLVVCGGLGARGSAKNDVQLFNLSTRRWLPAPRKTRIPTASSAPITHAPRRRHSHLSCVSVNRLFIIGGKDASGAGLDDICVYDLERKEWTTIQRTTYSPSLNIDHALCVVPQFHVRTLPWHFPCAEGTTAGTMKPFSCSELATTGSPCDIYLSNSDHPQGGIHTITHLAGGQIKTRTFATNTSNAPVSVRLPSGGILGSTLVLAGNHPVDNTDQQSQQSFCIWTLDLTANHGHWTRIDTGELNGSWGNGYLWHEQNKFFTLGKRALAEKLVDDGALGWDAVSVLDLEALGVYQPPQLKLDVASQKLGLASLANGQHTDFTFFCEDGRGIPCQREVVMERWDYLRERHARLSGAEREKHGKRIEITITDSSVSFAQSYAVTMALLQYLYSLALGTTLQRAPAVLSHLLIISTEFEIPVLEALVRHAMHLALDEVTAEGVYEIAASCGCRSLKIRAFRIIAETRDKRRAQAASPVGRRIGRGRSNSEGTRLLPHGARSAGVTSTGFPPSAFARPLHSTNDAANRLQTTTSPQLIPRVPPIPPSASGTTRTSDPLPRALGTVQVASLPQNSLRDLHGVAQIEREQTSSQLTDSRGSSKKRSQSVGTRIPRRSPRAAGTTTPTSKLPVPTVPTIDMSKYKRPFSRSAEDTIEGPRPQRRGRKVQPVLLAKGENMRSK